MITNNFLKECETIYKDFMERDYISKDYYWDEVQHFLNDFQLDQDEKLLCLSPVGENKWYPRRGILILTDKNIYIRLGRGKGPVSGGTKISLRNTQLIEYSQSMGHTLIIYLKGGDKLDFGLPKPGKLAEIIQKQIEVLNDIPSFSTSFAEKDDIIEKMERLFKLKQNDAISEEEYNLFKKKLLE